MIGNDKPASESAAALSEEDEGRFIKWAIDYAKRFDGQYHVNTYDLRQAAEYVTKYERERQAAELDKLRTTMLNVATSIRESTMYSGYTSWADELEDAVNKQP